MRYNIAIGAAVFGALALTSPAKAYDCESIVVDEAGLFGSDSGKVEDAANTLIKKGTNVRIFTVQSFGSFGSLDHYKADVQKDCASWRSPDGGMRNNLIVFGAAVESRDVSVYFGDQWRPSFTDSAVTHIIENVMAPRFRDGDFAGGFVDTMNYSGKLIDLQLSPSEPGGTTIIEAPTDNSGFVSWLFWALGALFVFIGGFFVFRVLMQSNEKKGARRTALQRAELAKTSCASGINNFDLTMLTAKVNSAAGGMTDTEAEELRQRLKSLEKAHQGTSAEFARLESTSASDFDNPDFTAENFDELARSYGSLAEKIADIEAKKAELENEVDTAMKAATEAPQKIAAAEAAIAKATSDITDIGKKGFKTESAEALKGGAEKLLAGARSALESKKAGSAAKLADEAKKKAAEASALAESLPQMKSVLEAKIASLSARAEAIAKGADAAEETFVKMEAEFAESSWSNIAGNGTEADNRIKYASKAVEEATRAISMEKQDWQKGETLVAEAGTLLDEAEKLLIAIEQTHRSILDAIEKAAAEVNAAEADITKAAEFIDRHDDDIRDELETDLDAARKQLEAAKKELGRKQPDYVKALKLALAANSSADSILAKAQDEHEAAERERHRAESLMHEAKRSIDAADSYIDNHSSDVEDGAKAKLKEARSYYEQALQARNLESQIGYADNADKAADAALAKAKQDVEEEEQRISRHSHRGDGFSTGVVVGSVLSSRKNHRTSTWGSPSLGSGGGRRSSGGGGSLSLGRSSSGGGGSFSIGRSSGGGGRSGKW